MERKKGRKPKTLYLNAIVFKKKKKLEGTKNSDNGFDNIETTADSNKSSLKEF